MKALNTLKNELDEELSNILNYWVENTLDNEYGGFVGAIDSQNSLVAKASKGIILNSRILWSFSRASNYYGNSQYDVICERAFDYLISNFVDQINGGVFWELDYKGNPINDRKQIYGQAFSIYALSEYYLSSKKDSAKKLALELFHLIETKSKDLNKGGYIEALSANWEPLEDMRLSPKDMNAAKTMNTHLHILECYTTLSQIAPEKKEVKQALKALTELILDKFLSEEDRFHLFFDENWNLLSNTVSYGHDIETVWLVLDAAREVGDTELTRRCEQMAVAVSNYCLKYAFDDNGVILNEKNFDTGVIDYDRHWWPQMEAMVGLAYTYKLTNDQKYLAPLTKIWDYVKEHIIDHEYGEWFFRVDRNNQPYNEHKVSMWKAPYHSSRACMVLNEIL